MEGGDVSERWHQATVVGAAVRGTGKTAVAPKLELEWDVEARAQTGSSVAQYADPFAPRQELALNHVGLTWSPLSGLSLMGGALSQSTWTAAGGILHSQSFPALHQSFEMPLSREFSVRAQAQQAIATQTVLSQVRQNRVGSPPRYFHEQIGLSWKRNLSQASVHVGHFQLQGLATSLARKGRFLGNQVIGLGDSSRFSNTFRGFEAGARGALALDSQWTVVGAVQGWWNQGAQDRALEMELGTRVRLPNDWTLAPSVFGFRREQNVFPASFVNPWQGNTNRQGWGLGVEVGWKDFSVGGRWLRAVPIQASPYQEQMRSVQLFFVRKYEI